MAELSNGGSAVAVTMSDARTRPLAAASPTSSTGIGPNRDATRARCSSTDVMAAFSPVTSITAAVRLPGRRVEALGFLSGHQHHDLRPAPGRRVEALVSRRTRLLALGTGEC